MTGPELWDLERKHDVFLDECFGPGRVASRAEVEALVFLNWVWEAGPTSPRRVVLEERPDLLGHLVTSLGVFGRGNPAQRPRRSAYLEALASRPVHEVSGGVDFDVAANLCQALAGRG